MHSAEAGGTHGPYQGFVAHTRIQDFFEDFQVLVNEASQSLVALLVRTIDSSFSS
jgi:hypothetical protein